jgi:hypothetical protein
MDLPRGVLGERERLHERRDPLGVGCSGHLGMVRAPGRAHNAPHARRRAAEIFTPARTLAPQAVASRPVAVGD